MLSVKNRALSLINLINGIAFLLLSLRLVAVNLCHLPLAIAAGGFVAVLVLAAFSWVRMRWVLTAFIAGIPLVSGLKTTGVIMSAPVLSFSFAVIYCTWFFKRVLWQRESKASNSVIGTMVDLLATLVMVSLAMSVMSFYLYPADFILQGISTHRVSNPNDVFWCMEASYIFLQGLFFYRILEAEMGGQENERTIRFILYAQVTIIIFFSLLHLLFHIPDTFHYKTHGIFSPFNDAHSYGSYLAFMFFVFLNLIGIGGGAQRIISFVIACFLAILIAFSGSRITWITVGLIGFCFLLYILDKRGRAIVVSAIVIPLLLINLFPGPLEQSDNGYLKRFSTVVLFKGYVEKDLNTNLAGRLLWWSRAYNILAEEPATGTGIGSFCRVSPSYTPERFLKREKLHENAHNYYLQLAAEIGIPALLLFLGALFFVFKAGFKALARDNFYPKRLISGILIGLGAYLITMLTGHPLLLSNQQFLFWSLIAFVVVNCYRSSGNEGLWKVPQFYTHLLIGLLVIVTVAGYAHKVTEGKNLLDITEYGLHRYENWNGKKMRWTMGTSGVHLKAESELIGFDVFAAPHNIDVHGLELKVYINDELLDKIHFLESGYKPIQYYLPGMAGQDMSLKMKVSKIFNPSKLRINKDTRDLGVAISPFTFMKNMPKDGVGFYEWESPDTAKTLSVSKDLPIHFRWTRMWASLNVPRQFKEGGELFLMCSHPDIADKPVVVDIMSDDGLIRRETFTDHNWKKVVVKAEDVTETPALTFQVSRTWNPKLEGISDDSRDLGVAVGFKPFRPTN